MFSKKFAAAAVVLMFAVTPVWAVENAVSQDAVNEAAADISAHQESGVVSQETKPAAPVHQAAEAVTVLPEVYAESLKYVKNDASKLKKELEALLSEGKEKEAARKLGSVFGREHGGEVSYLGFYSIKFLPFVDKSLDVQAKFMAQFLRGYGDAGVLLFSTGALSGFSVYGKDGSGPWENASLEAAVGGQKTGRVFKRNGIVAIPFSSGEIFRLDLLGREGGETKMCKILPGGANVKSWTGGKWERDVTVRGDKLF